MPIERRDGWWLWVGGPVPPQASGITIGRLVIVRRGRERNERLLRHELEHVAQYERYGIVGFLRRYLAAYVRWRVRGYGHMAAYRRIPFEAAAEWRARRSLGWGVVPVDAEVSAARAGLAPRVDAAAEPSPVAAAAVASPPAGASSPR